MTTWANLGLTRSDIGTRKANAKQHKGRLICIFTVILRGTVAAYEGKTTRASHLIFQMKKKHAIYYFSTSLQTPVIYNSHFIIWCIQVIVAAKFINPGKIRVGVMEMKNRQ